MIVLKADGTSEPFSEEKVIHSIQRAGIPKELQDKVLAHVKSRVHDKITTFEIYHHITEFLSHSPQPYTTGKYSLKQSLMLLGPSGYPFEDYVSELLKHLGYTTEVRQLLTGHCVTHEIDVVAEKNGVRAAIEAKFHNDPGNRSDLHVSLYTKARFDDIKEKHNLQETWIVTNTKATTDAITFAECSEMKIISWGYPDKGSLRDLIEQFNLYPITAVTALSLGQKKSLLDKHIVTCVQLKESPEVLQELFLNKDQVKKVKEELAFLTQKS